ncbi:MAG: dTDP-4-dehydrorhamnose reductase [Desulfovibrionaceae bacterium]|nr:dTDP-4-dehydrorhamnose reductase [Desulfovibrionaceae bacterium]
MRQKALVLGGKTGLVGQALAEVLRASGWDVAAPGREELDVAAPDAAGRLEALIDSSEPSCVFNTIAYTKVDAAEDEPEAATLLNRTLPATLGRIMKTRPCTLVHFSTDFVFDGKKRTPYTPQDPTAPLCVYGKTKLAGEEALLSFDLPHCLIIRTAWLFGPGRKNFVSTILQACKEKRIVNVVHDQIGSPTYTPDLAQYTLKLVESGASGIFHIVNNGQASWCELAGEAVSLAQAECMVNPIPSSEYPQKARRPAYSVLDCDDLARLTGIMPRPWPQALREYIFKIFH